MTTWNRDTLLRAISDPNFAIPNDGPVGYPIGEIGARGAVAANVGIVAIQPGKNIFTRVEGIIISNSGAVDNYRVSICTYAALFALAASKSSPTPTLDLGGAAGFAGTKRNSEVAAYINVATSGDPGDQFQNVRVKQDETYLVQLPRPGIILCGDDPGGPPALIVVGATNHDVQASFIGREWIIPDR